MSHSLSTPKSMGEGFPHIQDPVAVHSFTVSDASAVNTPGQDGGLPPPEAAILQLGVHGVRENTEQRFLSSDFYLLGPGLPRTQRSLTRFLTHGGFP